MGEGEIRKDTPFPLYREDGWSWSWVGGGQLDGAKRVRRNGEGGGGILLRSAAQVYGSTGVIQISL